MFFSIVNDIYLQKKITFSESQIVSLFFDVVNVSFDAILELHHEVLYPLIIPLSRRQPEELIYHYLEFFVTHELHHSLMFFNSLENMIVARCKVGAVRRIIQDVPSKFGDKLRISFVTRRPAKDRHLSFSLLFFFMAFCSVSL